MSLILAIETSSVACSVALGSGEPGAPVHHRHLVRPRAHSRLLLPMIEELCSAAHATAADLGLVAFGAGPGSFTGLRIAASVAQGIAWGRDLPVLGVSSLAVLAATAREAVAEPHDRVLALADARMGELYWQSFEADATLRPLGEAAIGSGESVASVLAGAPTARWLVVGDGLDAGLEIPWPQNVARLERREVLPDARCLLALAASRRGEATAARDAVPRYLRDERRWRRMGDGEQ